MWCVIYSFLNVLSFMCVNSTTASIGEFPEVRLCSLREEEGQSASGPRNNNKRKEPSQGEGDHSKTNPSRRPTEDVSAEHTTPEASGIRKMVPPLPPSSFPAEGTSANKDFLLPSSFLIEGTLRDNDFLLPSYFPIEGTLRGVRGQGSPNQARTRTITFLLGAVLLGPMRPSHKVCVRLLRKLNGSILWLVLADRIGFLVLHFHFCIELLFHRPLKSSSPSCFAMKPGWEKP